MEESSITSENSHPHYDTLQVRFNVIQWSKIIPLLVYIYRCAWRDGFHIFRALSSRFFTYWWGGGGVRVSLYAKVYRVRSLFLFLAPSWSRGEIFKIGMNVVSRCPARGVPAISTEMPILFFITICVCLVHVSTNREILIFDFRRKSDHFI